MIQFILRLMKSKILTYWKVKVTMNSWISILTFTFTTVRSAFVVFTALKVTIAFCGQKIISDYHNLGLQHLLYSTLLIYCTGMAIFWSNFFDPIWSRLIHFGQFCSNLIQNYFSLLLTPSILQMWTVVLAFLYFTNIAVPNFQKWAANNNKHDKGLEA